jgi:DNA-damage-inducible protein J
MKTANLNIRIDPETKMYAEKLFAGFGITVTDAVNIFLKQSIMVGGLPFEMKNTRFNADTEIAMKEALDISNGKIQSAKYNSAKELSDEIERQ